jgi:hypothetical protein
LLNHLTSMLARTGTAFQCWCAVCVLCMAWHEARPILKPAFMASNIQGEEVSLHHGSVLLPLPSSTQRSRAAALCANGRAIFPGNTVPAHVLIVRELVCSAWVAHSGMC